MNHEPSTWLELFFWLDAKRPDGHYPDLFDGNERANWTALVWVELSISKVQNQHKAEVEKAAKNFADLQEKAFLPLSKEARLCFVMRLWAAREFVDDLAMQDRQISNGRIAEMIPFPTATFREILAWLLIDWWEVWGKPHEADFFWKSHLEAMTRTTSK